MTFWTSDITASVHTLIYNWQLWWQKECYILYPHWVQFFQLTINCALLINERITTYGHFYLLINSSFLQGLVKENWTLLMVNILMIAMSLLCASMIDRSLGIDIEYLCLLRSLVYFLYCFTFILCRCVLLLQSCTHQVDIGFLFDCFFIVYYLFIYFFFRGEGARFGATSPFTFLVLIWQGLNPYTKWRHQNWAHY